MAEGVTNLNAPPAPDVPVAEAKSDVLGRLTEKWRAWFTALAEVVNWTVTGALTVTGLTTLNGGLVLGQAVATPAAGQVGAGDANFITVGSGGNIPGTAIPVPSFTNSWAAAGGGVVFRKYSTGQVELQFTMAGGANNTVAFTFPAGWRPGRQVNHYILDQTRAGITQTNISIATTGAVTVGGGITGGDQVSDILSFCAEQ